MLRIAWERIPRVPEVYSFLVKTGELERRSHDQEAQNKPLVTRVHKLISMRFMDRITHHTGKPGDQRQYQVVCLLEAKLETL